VLDNQYGMSLWIAWPIRNVFVNWMSLWIHWSSGMSLWTECHCVLVKWTMRNEFVNEMSLLIDCPIRNFKVFNTYFYTVFYDWLWKLAINGGDARNFHEYLASPHVLLFNAKRKYIAFSWISFIDIAVTS
jgi:hypothetical protein